MNGAWVRMLVMLAGAGQLALAAASLTIPRVLRWRDETAKLRPLTGQVFWTYAVYIWGTNVSLGLLSLLAPSWLLVPEPLARAVTGYITLYWGGRLVVQFTYFDRASRPPGVVFKLAEVGMVVLFAYLTVLYGALTLGVGARAS